MCIEDSKLCAISGMISCNMCGQMGVITLLPVAIIVKYNPQLIEDVLSIGRTLITCQGSHHRQFFYVTICESMGPEIGSPNS